MALGSFAVCMYATIGVLFAAMVMPLIAPKVPPNDAYAFRVRKTLDAPKVRYLSSLMII